MALVQCELCGKGVNTAMDNYRYKNNVHQHIKCPKSGEKLSPEEAKDLQDLKDAIKWLTENQGKYLSPKQWRLVTAQIKTIKEQGYSYKDQLTAFKWYFDLSKDNEYIGYGIVEYIIEQALHETDDYGGDNSSVTESEYSLQEIMEKKRLERLAG